MTPPVDYILTTFSPTMFGSAASVYIREVEADVAKKAMNGETPVVANRDSHRNMAANLFGNRPNVRYADMQPGKSAIIIHYRGPAVPDDGTIPDEGSVSFYHIESEEYLDPEDDE